MIVLNYHELVETSPTNAWCLTHDAFDAHLALCGDMLISPQNFMDHWSHPKTGRNSGILLTFDDGFLSDYTHVYNRYIMTGRIPGFISFIPVDFVGTAGRMDWTMIEEISRGGGVIGSHGMAHADLTTVSDVELSRELKMSKSILEHHLGKEVPLFAFPYGRFSRRVWDAALKAGYTHLFTIQLGYHRGFESFLCSRLCLTNNMDAEYMRQHLLDPNTKRGIAWKVSTKLGLYRPLMRWRYR
ncbi:polysaccharide deacetylase family protein [Nitrobacter sp. TKz-YC01]